MALLAPAHVACLWRAEGESLLAPRATSRRYSYLITQISGSEYYSENTKEIDWWQGVFGPVASTIHRVIAMSICPREQSKEVHSTP
jgi:hypothetical protein